MTSVEMNATLDLFAESAYNLSFHPAPFEVVNTGAGVFRYALPFNFSFTVRMPQDVSGHVNVTFELEARSTENTGVVASTFRTVNFQVSGVADPPVLVLGTPLLYSLIGVNDSVLELVVESLNHTDIDGSETMALTMHDYEHIILGVQATNPGHVMTALGAHSWRFNATALPARVALHVNTSKAGVFNITFNASATEPDSLSSVSVRSVAQIGVGDISLTHSTDEVVVLDEVGSSRRVRVSLSAPPQGTVHVRFSSVRGLASVSPSSVVFSARNWTETPGVKIRAEPDDYDLGVNYTDSIEIDVVGTDPLYPSLTFDNISLIIRDDDEIGVAMTDADVTLAGDLEKPLRMNVTEGGTDSYLISLSSRPRDTVYLSLGGDAGNVTTASVAGTTFTFPDSSDWEDVLEIPIRIADDNVARGAQRFEVVHTLRSNDSRYDGMMFYVVIRSNDDDIARLVLSRSALVVGIDFTNSAVFGDSFVVELGTRPLEPVNITVESVEFVDVAGDCVVCGQGTPSWLQFDRADWNTGQDLAVTAFSSDDTAELANRTVRVNLTASSADSAYDGLTAGLLLYVKHTGDKTPPPALEAAQFSDDGGSVFVTFDSPTNQAGAECSDLFSNTDLGSQPTCQWTDDTSVLISLDADTSILSGDLIRLIGGVVKSSFSSAKLFAEEQSTELLDPSTPLFPTVSMTSPTSVSICQAVVLDATASSGAGGRDWTFLRWSVSSPNDFELGNLTTLLEAATDAESLRVEIPALTLQSNRQYEISLRLKNFFENAGTTTVLIQTLPSAAPSIEIDGSTVISVISSDTVRLRVNSESPVICSGFSVSGSLTRLVHDWYELKHNVPVAQLDQTPKTPTVVRFPAKKLEPGLDYEFLVVVSMEDDPTVKNNATVAVTVDYSNPTAVVLGGNRVARVAENLTLDGGTSYDVDFPNATLEYAWTCIQLTNFSQPCTSSILERIGTLNSSTLEIPAFTLHNGTWQFTLFVQSTADAPFLRNGTTTTSIVAIEGTAPTVSLDRSDGVISAKAGHSVEVVGSAFVTEGSIDSRRWSIVSPANADATRIFALPTSGSRMVLNTEHLTAGQTYTVRFTVSGTATTVNGFAEVNLEVNEPPRLGELATTPRQGEALITSFSLVTSRWVDASEHFPLAFTFLSSVDNDTSNLADEQWSSSLAVDLPLGSETDNFTVYLTVVARDQLDASATAADSVRCVEPAVFAATDDDASGNEAVTEFLVNSTNDLFDTADKQHGDDAVAGCVRVGQLTNRAIGRGRSRSGSSRRLAGAGSLNVESLRTRLLELCDSTFATLEDTDASFEIRATALSTVGSFPSELNAESQELLFDLVRDVLDDVESAGTTLTTTMRSSLLDILSFVAQTNTFENTSLWFNGTLPENESLRTLETHQVITDALLAADSFIDMARQFSNLLLVNTFAGVGATVLDATNDAVTVYSELVERSDLNLDEIDAGDGYTATLPSNISADPGLSGSDTEVSIVAFRLNKNVFGASPYTEIFSDLLTVDLLGTAGEELSVQGLQEPVSFSLSYNSSAWLDPVNVSVMCPDNNTAMVSAPCPLGRVDVACNTSAPTPHNLTVTCPTLVPACVFWDAAVGNWSGQGCNVTGYTSSEVQCACNHLTSFAATMVESGASSVAVFPADFFEVSTKAERVTLLVTWLGVLVFTLMVWACAEGRERRGASRKYASTSPAPQTDLSSSVQAADGTEDVDAADNGKPDLAEAEAEAEGEREGSATRGQLGPKSKLSDFLTLLYPDDLYHTMYMRETVQTLWFALKRNHVLLSVFSATTAVFGRVSRVLLLLLVLTADVFFVSVFFSQIAKEAKDAGGDSSDSGVVQVEFIVAVVAALLAGLITSALGYLLHRIPAELGRAYSRTNSSTVAPGGADGQGDKKDAGNGAAASNAVESPEIERLPQEQRELIRDLQHQYRGQLNVERIGAEKRLRLHALEKTMDRELRKAYAEHSRADYPAVQDKIYASYKDDLQRVRQDVARSTSAIETQRSNVRELERKVEGTDDRKLRKLWKQEKLRLRMLNKAGATATVAPALPDVSSHATGKAGGERGAVMGTPVRTGQGEEGGEGIVASPAKPSPALLRRNSSAMYRLKSQESTMMDILDDIPPPATTCWDPAIPSQENRLARMEEVAMPPAPGGAHGLYMKYLSPVRRAHMVPLAPWMQYATYLIVAVLCAVFSMVTLFLWITLNQCTDCDCGKESCSNKASDDYDRCSSCPEDLTGDRDLDMLWLYAVLLSVAWLFVVQEPFFVLCSHVLIPRFVALYLGEEFVFVTVSGMHDLVETEEDEARQRRARRRKRRREREEKQKQKQKQQQHREQDKAGREGNEHTKFEQQRPELSPARLPPLEQTAPPEAKDNRVRCRLGCGKMVDPEQLEHHEQNRCPQRMWDCPCGTRVQLFDRLNHLLECSNFKQCWEQVLERFLVSVPKAELEKRIAAVVSLSRRRPDLAFCALAENSGDVEKAVQKLESAEYRKEMKLVSEVCTVKNFVRAKKRGKRAGRTVSGNGEHEGEGGGPTLNTH